MRYNITKEITKMEHWKAIVGYEGLYEVSDQGRVKSLRCGKEKLLKPRKVTGGYLQVTLCKEGRGKEMLVHRLVAEAFIPNPNNLETVNHKDEMKTNNAVSNLEWMSPEENCNWGTRNKRIAEAKSNSVQMFDKSTGELLATFPSTMEAERVTRIHQGNICRCCLGNRKSSGGYIWRYL